MDSKSMAISDLQGGGDLFRLPREVRDEIYRYLVKGNHTIVKPPEWVRWVRDYAHTDYAHTAILASSKAIGREAALVMHGESNFHSRLDFSDYLNFEPYTYLYTHHATEVCDRLMNLTYRIFGLDGSARRPSCQADLERMKGICAATIERFTGTDVLRKRLQIIIYWAVDIENKITSPFFETLKRLRRFRTIRLQLNSLPPHSGEKDPQHLFEQMNKKLQAIEAYLGPALGPGDHSFSTKANSNYNIYSGCLTFHPNKHMNKTSGMVEEEEEEEIAVGFVGSPAQTANT